MWYTPKERLQLTHLCLLGIFPREELIGYAVCTPAEQASTSCPTKDNAESYGENRGGVESDRKWGALLERENKGTELRKQMQNAIV